MPLATSTRRAVLLTAAAASLAACTTPIGSGVGTGGSNRISDREADRVPFRALDAVNALRVQSGQSAVGLDSSLSEAAATHSRDMSLQNRPWHWGSDGSSPIDRVRRAGFDGRFLGETISETFDSELETIVAWSQDPSTRRILLDPAARRMGFAFFQESNGKIWWTMVMGTGAARATA